MAANTFTIRQDAPQLNPGDDGRLAYTATITGEGGLKGQLDGHLVSVSRPGEGPAIERRIGHLTFDFGDGHTIQVGGVAAYPRGAHEMDAGKPQVRTVTGGTGRHMGARGQVTTIRHELGHYEHRFELMD